MSAKHGSEKPAGKTKKFGKGERQIPHHSHKAKKYYPAEDESKPKKVRVSVGYTEQLRPCQSCAAGDDRNGFMKMQPKKSSGEAILRRTHILIPIDYLKFIA